jgi:hypothetical protein
MKIQLNLDFSSKRFENLEEAVIHAIHTSPTSLKHLAGELGHSPAGLSKRLNLTPMDNEPRLSLKDLEKFMEVTGDYRPIHYLIERFLQKDEEKILAEFREFKRKIPELKKFIALMEK